MDLSGGQLPFYLGIVLMSFSVVCGIGAGFILRASGKRLRKQLEDEFGPKRH